MHTGPDLTVDTVKKKKREEYLSPLKTGANMSSQIWLHPGLQYDPVRWSLWHFHCCMLNALVDISDDNGHLSVFSHPDAHRTGFNCNSPHSRQEWTRSMMKKKRKMYCVIQQTFTTEIAGKLLPHTMPDQMWYARSKVANWYQTWLFCLPFHSKASN